MAKKNSQKSLKETYCDIFVPENPLNAQKALKLPFRNGVIADLSGNASLKEKPHMDDRKFVDVDIVSFPKFMKSIQPASTFNVESTLSENETLHVHLKFENMKSFTPVEVAKQVPALNRLLQIRKHLKTLSAHMDGRRDAQAEISKLLRNPQLMLAFSQSKKSSGEPDTSHGVSQE